MVSVGAAHNRVNNVSSGGFTLIELAIVVTIIGLTISAIFVGDRMIRAAELRAIHTEFESIATAVATFRTKYGCLPGDCPNATEFFGLDPNGCPPMGGMGGPAGTPGTCDGDGTGNIAAATDSIAAAEAWRQLSHAGLLSGSFAGTWSAGSGVTAPFFMPDYNCPRIGNSNSCFVWTNLADTPAFALIEGSGNRLMTLSAAMIAFPVTSPGLQLMAASDALTYDTKFDDGRPASGQVQALSAVVAPNCVDVAPDPDDSLYRVTDPDVNCGFIYNAPSF